jgi:hypothetical protein
LLAGRRYRLAASSRNSLLVQSIKPGEVSRLLVWRSHFAVSHFLGFVVFQHRAALATLSRQCILSSSSAFLQSLRQHTSSVDRDRQTTLLGSCSLQHVTGSEVHLPRALPAPTTFRPQGLATLSAAYSFRAHAGFISHRPRSWDSPFGAFSSRKVSARFRADEPTCRFACRCSLARIASGRGRPNRLQLLGFNPFESPWRPTQD